MSNKKVLDNIHFLLQLDYSGIFSGVEAEIHKYFWLNCWCSRGPRQSNFPLPFFGHNLIWNPLDAIMKFKV